MIRKPSSTSASRLQSSAARKLSCSASTRSSHSRPGPRSAARSLPEPGVELRVASTQVSEFDAELETFAGVFANRLEHPEPLPVLANEILVDQRGKGVEVGVAHGLGGVDGPPAAKDRQPVEESLSSVVRSP